MVEAVLQFFALWCAALTFTSWLALAWHQQQSLLKRPLH
jgi:hypothetical protein